MRLYEIVYIFDPSVSEEGVTQKLERYHGIATRTSGAEVIAVDPWGARQLAYPVGPHKSGQYVVAHVRMAPEDLTEFERVIGLDGELIRHLIVVNEGEPTNGMSILAERPESATRREEEDDDDDDGDEGAPDEDDDDEGRRGPVEFSGGRGRRRRIEGPAIELLNYKDVGTLSKFMTEQGKILPKRTTKVTAAFQRTLGRAIKRARYLALIPYVRDHEA
ncbi:MAG: 30S ribosomal protein S18 [Gemmatimonadota bacterium]|nr:30S ribosomal protein S18 [Gemmatimonadota bacterium]